MSVKVSFIVSPCKGKPHMSQQIRDLIQHYDWSNGVTRKLLNRNSDWNIFNISRNGNDVTFEVSFKNGKESSRDVKRSMFEMIQSAPTIKVKNLQIENCI